jgi:peptide/nickel transport system permease protein
MVSLVVLGVVVVGSIVGSHLWHHDYGALDPADASQAPSWDHPMGTDALGRDLFAQVLRGTQITVQIMLVVTILATLAGVLVGALAGWRGGLVDAVLMRVVDVALTIPVLAALLVLARRVESNDNWFPLSVVVAAFAWLTVARVVRAEVRTLRTREYVEAARAAGGRGSYIVVRHVLPNLAGTLVVAATITMAGAILAESALSYLGFGVQSPDTSLGLLVSEGQNAAQTRPWLFWFPGLVIVLIVLCVNFVGDGLRDAFDPQQDERRA